MIREPVVAGQFYPAEAKSLKKQIQSFVDKNASKTEAKACILPHAGYVYSGAVAGKTISKIRLKNNVIIIGPNHTGYGRPFALIRAGIFKTPLGDVPINQTLSESLLMASRYLEEDVLAHSYEHSLEVELPFLQFFSTSFEIVPIVASCADDEIYFKIGEDIASVVKKLKIENKVVIIASSDMTHYEPDEIARQKDMKAIDAILKLDVDEFLKTIRKEGVSMCGYIPAAITMVAAKSLGAKKAQLIKYQTSGEVLGDYSSVVGYAGVILS